MDHQGNTEKKVAMAVMVPLIISHDGAVHEDTIRRWKVFAPDIKVDWVRMGQNVLRYIVVIAGRFFNKGSLVSEAWREEHADEFDDEAGGPPKRIETGEERRERLHLDQDPVSVVCAAFGHATSTQHSVDVHGKGKPEQRELAGQSNYLIEFSVQFFEAISSARKRKKIKDSSPPSENRRRVFKQPSTELSVTSKTLTRPHMVFEN